MMHFNDNKILIHIGNSYRNREFPTNRTQSSFSNYFVLFLRVLWQEINNFYTLYFLCVGILQCFPVISKNDPAPTFCAIFIIVFASYLVQAVDLHRNRKGIAINDNKRIKIVRDGVEFRSTNGEIKPGDIFQVTNKAALPCDALLLHSNLYTVYVDTSSLDGETEVKDKYPVILSTKVSEHDIIGYTGCVYVTDPESESRDVSGFVTLNSGFLTSRVESNGHKWYSSQKNHSTNFVSVNLFQDNDANSSSYLDESYMDSLNSLDAATIREMVSEKNLFIPERILPVDLELDEYGDLSEDDLADFPNLHDDARYSDSPVSSSFNRKNFVERSSKICSPGVHTFVALYTGENCRSRIKNYGNIYRTNAINPYIEALSLLFFTLQLIISIILTLCGYLKATAGDQLYSSEFSTETTNRVIIFLIIFARNFLLLVNIPLSVKIVIPLFRLVYGLFIGTDLNFFDPHSNSYSYTVSRSMIENLGSVDIIVTDKTGTLTNNQLNVVSLSIGDHIFGNGQDVASIYEDPNFMRLYYSNYHKSFMHFVRGLYICHTTRVTKRRVIGASSDELSIIDFLLNNNIEFSYPDHHNVRVVAKDIEHRYTILRIIPFNRKRMRMSVVIKDDDGIFVYMKGAPERVLRKCVQSYGNSLNNYKELQTRGLRVISYSYREVKDFSHELSNKYLEQDHIFLGSVGIEDSIQQDAQLSIQMFNEAGIKTWVATGGGAINSLSISSSLKLIDKDRVVQLTSRELKDNLSDFISKSNRVKENTFACIIDCERSKDIYNSLSNPAFVQALVRAKSAIFYRCKPQTKGDIVESLKSIGLKVLAAGDGMNDTVLLKSADVGICISKTGLEDFRSCDIVVPKFHNLTRLVLVHGHMSQHRSVLAIHFSFYKCLLYSFVQGLFQIWTDFSATPIFSVSAENLYNLIWTIIPMISVLFEKDVSEPFLLRLSSLYQRLKHPLQIKKPFTEFFFMLLAVIQAFSIVIVSYLITGESFYHYESGKDFGADFLFNLLYIVLVFTTSLYLVMHLNILTYYSIVALTGNIVLLFATTEIFQLKIDSSSYSEWKGFYGECFSNRNVLFIFVLLLISTTAPAWFAQTVFNEVAFQETLLIAEKESMAVKEERPLFFDPKPL